MHPRRIRYTAKQTRERLICMHSLIYISRGSVSLHYVHGSVPPSRRGGGTTSYDVVKRRGVRRGKRVCGARAEKRKRARGDKRNDNIKRGRVANERGGTGIGQVCSGLVRDYRYTAWKLEGSFDSGEDLTTVELIFLRTRVSRIK